jgi:hypothetical protein
VSACRSCGKPILWARTTARKNMPLDRDPVEDGNVEIVGWDGPFRLVRVVAAGEGTHVSHFVSCPNAATHRGAT